MDDTRLDSGRKTAPKRRKPLFVVVLLLLMGGAAFLGGRFWFERQDTPAAAKKAASGSFGQGSGVSTSDAAGQPWTAGEDAWRGSGRSGDREQGGRLPSAFDAPDRAFQFPADQNGKEAQAKRRQQAGEELPVESASAMPAPSRPSFSDQRTTVMPPSVSAGYRGGQDQEIVPPAFADIGETLPPAREDRLISPSFISNLAHLMVQSYYPPGARSHTGKNGSTVLTLQRLDSYYGQGFYGMNVVKHDPARARQTIFSYIMNPAMITGLYTLYVDRFVRELDQESKVLVREINGKRRPLNEAERKEMFRLYSQDVKMLAGVLSAACTPEIEKRIELYQRATQEATQAGNRYAETAIALEEAKETAAHAQGLKAMEEAGAVYQAASRKKQQERQALLQEASRQLGRQAAGEEVLYGLLWGQRRIASGTNGRECVRSMAQMLDNLSQRLSTASSALGE